MVRLVAACAVRFPRLFIPSLAIALAGCPQSPGLAPYPSTFAGAPFSQADLAGDWSYAAIFHAPGVAAGTMRGWERGALRVAASGDVTVLSVAASDGTSWSTAPTPWTIDSDGFVTTPPGSYVGFHLKLGAARALATATGTTGGNGAALWILQRISATTSFSGADLAGTAWAYHRLTTGASPSWEHGVAAFDADLVLSMTERVVPDGVQPDPAPAGAVAVDASGGVTLAGDPTWRGSLSADKRLLVVTRTVASGVSPQFALEVYVRTGQTFTLAELAGRISGHTILAAPAGAAGWAWGVCTVSASGEVIWESSLTNAAQTTLPPPGEIFVAPDGTLTTSASPITHGTELYSKDGSARTTTADKGVVYSTFTINLR
jgi:hypothetical protein